MELDKAIELLDQKLPDIALMLDPDLCEAVQLGIEALKRIKEHRNKGYLRAHELLPGETEEERR